MTEIELLAKIYNILQYILGTLGAIFGLIAFKK